MRDLEERIAEWRGRLQAAGIQAPDVLDELESHLREEAEQQTRSGLNVERAFDTAVQKVGAPDILRTEFAKVGGTGESPQRFKRALLTLAGIPASTNAPNMNTTSDSNTHLEPGWATYLKAGAFLVPAIALWSFSIVFLVPKLREFCLKAGVAAPTVFHLAIFFTEHAAVICSALVLMLVLVEWRSRRWPRYRRATVGIGVFLLNAAVLVLITVMFTLALIAAPGVTQAR